jgi:hypothetical protein
MSIVDQTLPLEFNSVKWSEGSRGAVLGVRFVIRALHHRQPLTFPLVGKIPAAHQRKTFFSGYPRVWRTTDRLETPPSGAEDEMLSPKAEFWDARRDGFLDAPDSGLGSRTVVTGAPADGGF